MPQVFRNADALLATLRSRLPDLSDAQQRVARFITARYHEVPFMSASQLAQAVGVSQPSVTRFVARLGFQNYGEFTDAIKEVVIADLSPAQRFERTRNGAALTTTEVLEREAANVAGLARVCTSETFARCAERLARAERVLIVGYRSAAFLAHYTGFFLSKLRPSVSTAIGADSSGLDQLLHFDAQHDYVLLFAYPRYPREAVTLANIVRERGLPLGLIVDRADCPIAPHASEVLIAPMSHEATYASHAAPVALASLLFHAVGRVDVKRTQRFLAEFEQLASEANLFVPTSEGGKRS